MAGGDAARIRIGITQSDTTESTMPALPPLIVGIAAGAVGHALRHDRPGG
jgi:hypothetical protein